MKKLLTIAALLILALPLVAQNLQLTVEFPNTVVITGFEISADHQQTYVAFYEPQQEGLNGSVWVFDTDKGTVLKKYDNVCYQPVKIMYKKK